VTAAEEVASFTSKRLFKKFSLLVRSIKNLLSESSPA
jgi:hypothetical protein